MQQVSKNVYVETGFRGCNTAFVVTSDGVVMIDTPQIPSEAAKWRDEIKKFGPVRFVINTEPHGDHVSGNCFYEGVVVAHEGTRQAILASSAEQYVQRMKQMSPENASLLDGFRFRPPAVTLSRQLTIHLGEHTFQLTNFPGHTPYQVPVFVPEEGILFTSDNVVVNNFPFMHQCLINDWFESLKSMEALGANFLMPGHGPVSDRKAFTGMAATLQPWVDAVNDAIRKGWSVEEAKERINLLDRYPVPPERAGMLQQMQKNNIGCLYEQLKK